MYCNTKIMGYISHRIFEAINSNNDKENEVRNHEFPIAFRYKKRTSEC